jgi:hypothetical protein
LCTEKEKVIRLKRQPPEWQKIFASYSAGKRLLTRIYRELKNLNFHRINNPMKKWAREPNRYFSKGEVQINTQRCAQHLWP